MTNKTWFKFSDSCSELSTRFAHRHTAFCNSGLVPSNCLLSALTCMPVRARVFVAHNTQNCTIWPNVDIKFSSFYLLLGWRFIFGSLTICVNMLFSLYDSLPHERTIVWPFFKWLMIDSIIHKWRISKVIPWIRFSSDSIGWKVCKSKKFQVTRFEKLRIYL